MVEFEGDPTPDFDYYDGLLLDAVALVSYYCDGFEDFCKVFPHAKDSPTLQFFYEKGAELADIKKQKEAASAARKLAKLEKDREDAKRKREEWDLMKDDEKLQWIRENDGEIKKLVGVEVDEMDHVDIVKSVDTAYKMMDSEAK
jgi:hypothetical protein